MALNGYGLPVRNNSLIAPKYDILGIVKEANCDQFNKMLAPLLSDKNILFIGAPASGKGTYAKDLHDLGTIVHLSVGDVIKEALKHDSALKQIADAAMQKGGLVPDDVIAPILSKEIKKITGKGLILDGFPRTKNQVDSVRWMLKKIDAIIYFDDPKELLIARMENRRVCENKSCGQSYNVIFVPPKIEGKCDKCGGKLIQRNDDRREIFENRLDVFVKETGPVVEYLSAAECSKFFTLSCLIDNQSKIKNEFLLKGRNGEPYLLDGKQILNKNGLLMSLKVNLLNFFKK